MRPPIIVDNRGDVGIFETSGAAERYLEPIDIRHGEYVIYDSEGQRLEGVIAKRRLNEIVKLQPAPKSDVNPDALRHILIGFLSRVDHTPEDVLSSRSLPQLITDALRHRIK